MVVFFLWFGCLRLVLAGVYLFSVALWCCLLVCTVFWFCTWLGFYVGLDWLFCSVVWAICGVVYCVGMCGCLVVLFVVLLVGLFVLGGVVWLWWGAVCLSLMFGGFIVSV